MHDQHNTRRWQNWAAPLLLALIAILVWCTINNRWSERAWRTPVGYAGDAWWALAFTKSMADGEIYPVLSKTPQSLGAPFGANWNDYPSTEEAIYAWCALLAKWFGLFTSQHLAVLSGHVLAAWAFYYVCRYLRYNRLLSMAAAILFSFSRFAVSRGVFHLGLTLYWHVPLGLLVVWWCVARAPFEAKSRKTLIALGVAVVHATQNPYYTGMFLQFLVWAAFVCILQRRGWWRVLVPLGLSVVVFGTFVLMNADTFYSNGVNGPNPATVNRAYAGIELYALKPLELLLPAAHRITALQVWTNETYFTKALFIGEGGSPYLGLIGIIGLAALGWTTILAIARRNLQVPAHAWYVIWILLYGVVGGVNGFLGLFGMVLYRGTNRYSVVILCLLLLFLTRQLSRLTRAWRWPAVGGLAAAMVSIGLWDQVTRTLTDADVAGVAAAVESDRQFTKRLERKLPSGAMLFQLPVMGFPEVEPIVKLGDYAHFRPYLHSWDLRFSYGSAKGRPRERWQHEVERLGPAAMVTLLERYGFAAVLIARGGYADEGAELLAGLAAAGRQRKLAESPDFVCIELHPSANPVLPAEFDDRWTGLEGPYEGNWRWSTGDAGIALYNSSGAPKEVRLTFGLGTIKRRQVALYQQTRELVALALEPEQPAMSVETTVTLQPGKNILEFRTDVPADVPGNGDPRKMAFRITDFTVTE